MDDVPKQGLCGCGSGLLFYRCHGRDPVVLDGSSPTHLLHLRNMVSVRTLWDVERIRGTPEMLIRQIRRLSPKHVLLKIGHTALALRSYGARLGKDRVVSLDALSVLAALAVRYGDSRNEQEPSDYLMTKLVLTLNDLLGDRIPDDLPVAEQAAQLARQCVKLMQFNDLQIKGRYDFIRSWLLFQDLPAKGSSLFNIPAKIAETTGLTPEEYLFLGFGLWTLFSAQVDHIGVESFFRQEEPKMRLEQARLFIKQAAQPIEDYERGGTFSADRIFDLNPLFQKPLVIANHGMLICPVPPYLLYKATYGIYHVLLTQYRELFTESFGPVFQCYVGWLLEHFYAHGELIPEGSYGDRKGHVGLGFDWSVVEGGDAVVIECKAKRLRHTVTKATGDQDALKQDLREGIVGALRQLASKLDAVGERVHGFERLALAERIFPVVVIYEDIPLVNSPLFRRLVALAAAEEGVRIPGQYVVISVEELELGLPFLKSTGQTFFHLLSEWQADPDLRFESLNNFLFYKYGQTPLNRPLIDAQEAMLKRCTEWFFPASFRAA